MSEAIFSRVRVIGWLMLFVAPVILLEVGRELRVRWDSEDQIYAYPTPEFHAALAASELASAR